MIKETEEGPFFKKTEFSSHRILTYFMKGYTFEYNHAVNLLII